jgi:hypothetical protein
VALIANPRRPEAAGRTQRLTCGIAWVGRGGVEPPTFHFSGAYRPLCRVPRAPAERRNGLRGLLQVALIGTGCGRRCGQTRLTLRSHRIRAARSRNACETSCGLSIPGSCLSCCVMPGTPMVAESARSSQEAAPRWDFPGIHRRCRRWPLHSRHGYHEGAQGD